LAAWFGFPLDVVRVTLEALASDGVVTSG